MPSKYQKTEGIQAGDFGVVLLKMIIFALVFLL